MALLGTLQVRLGLDTAAFGQKFNSFTKDLEKRAKGFSRGLSGLTDFGSLVGSAGIGAALTQGISAAGNFESTINQVAAAADLGRGAIDGLTESALAMSKGTVFSANQTAQAMLELAKAGMSPADQAAGGLAATMQLAASEGLELSFAAEKIAEAMGAFKLQASDAASIADALAGASIASTASVEGLALGLSQVSAVANLAGLSIEETSGFLALLAQNGIKGSDAGTSLKTMLMRLSAPTEQAQKEMTRLGISFVNADGSVKPILESVEILSKRMATLTQAERASALQTIFGTDAYRAAAIAAGAGAEGVRKYIEASKDKNAAEKLSEARTQGFNGAVLRLRNTFEAIAIEISRGGFLEALTNIATQGAALVTRLSALPDWAKNLGIGFAVAAALLPPFALALSSIALAGPAILTGLGAITGFLLGPWGLAIAAAVGVAIAFKDQIIAGWNGLKAWFTGWVQENQGNLTLLRTAWDGFVNALRPLWEALKKGFGDIARTVLAAFGTDTTAAMEWFKTSAGNALTLVTQGATVLLNGLTIFVQWVTANIPATAAIFQATFTSIANVITEAKARFDEFVAFLRNSPAQIAQALASLWPTIKAAWDAIDWAQLGRDIVAGILRGVTSQFDKVRTVASTLATTLETVVRSKLNTHSPSKVFIDIGEDVGNGFVIGIRNKISEAGKAVQQLVSTGQSGFTNSFLTGATRNIVGPDADKQFKAWTESISKGAIQVQSAWSSAMTHVGSAIDEFVKTGKLNFSDLVRSIIADLASAALKNAFNGLLQGILGATGGMFGGSTGSSGGGILSGLGSIFGGIFGGMASFEGGGYTGTGSRSGGLDGRGGRLALLHPKETVIDHAAIKRDARGPRGGDIHVSTPITLMPGVSKEELAAILPMLKRDIIETIPALITRGGRYASAFGQ